ncbi:MAG: choice-of-anchor Q domain-containing protein [Planctomycetota bacterium]
MKTKIWVIMSAVVLLAGWPAVTPAAIRLVPSEYPTIQAGIDAAVDGDTVLVAPGRYTGAGNRDLYFGGKAIAVQSTNPDDPGVVAATVIDCGGSAAEPHRGFYFNSGENSTAVVAGLTIAHGYAQTGGAIRCFKSNPTIAKCVITGNIASEYGGGIYCKNSSAAISDCRISGNRAVHYGGGTCTTASNSRITNCTFSANWAGFGGGGLANLHSGSPVITNCVFSGNLAPSSGGGITNNWRSNPVLINCTVTANSTSWYAAGGMDNTDSTPVVSNCIFWANKNKRGMDESAQMDGGPIVNYSCIQGWTGRLGGTGNIDSDPCFAFDADCHLMFGSACIDTGTNTLLGELPATDVDGNPRLTDGDGNANAVIDMGAYEYNPDTPSIAVSRFSLSYVHGGAAPLPQTVFVRNCGGRVTNWQIVEDCGWLQVWPTSGTSGGQVSQVTLTVDSEGLAPGDYSCFLKIVDTNAVNSPVTMEIQLRVITELVHVPGQLATIQNAIDHVLEGGTVVVAEGIYSGPGNRNIDFRGKAITVKSDGGPAACIIDCEHQGRGFCFHNGEDINSILDGFTIMNGSSEYGGAISCEYSSPIVSNCIVRQNDATGGGGIHCYDSTLTIENCAIIANSAGYGGGILCGSHHRESTVVIINSTMAGNWAESEGGAVCCWNGNTGIINSTVTGNLAVNGGGGIASFGSSESTVSNSILWSNEGPYGAQIYVGPSSEHDPPGSASVEHSDIHGGQEGVYLAPGSALEWGYGNMDADPCFAFSQDYHLMPDSACIDAGTNTPAGGLPVTDVDGNPRILDGDADANAVADMGAYEYNPSRPSIAVSAQSFSYMTGYSMPTLSLHVRNCGGGSLNWEIAEDCDWLQITPTRGTSAGESHEVTLTIDPNDLATGDYVYALHVTDQNAANNPVPIAVQVHVGTLLLVPQDFSTIQAAIDAAGDYDTVVVHQGTYTGTGNRDIDFKGKRIIVRSTEPTDANIVGATIIDCAGTEIYPHRGFYFHNGEEQNSILAGFTITNGYANYGGAIHCWQSSPNITNCIMSGNTARGGSYWGAGGAIYCEQSHLTVSNCWISGNVAQRGGGGIYCRESKATITNCTLTGNTGHEGAGIYCWDSEVRISNCTILGNWAEIFGGGIECADGSLTVADSVITHNAAGIGGGIDGSDTILRVTNCLLADNTADSSGGGISCMRGSFVIANSIMTGNSASWIGGAACCRGSDGIVANCIVVGNKSDRHGSGILCDGGPALITNSTITGNRSAGEGAALALGPGTLTVSNCIVWNNWPEQIEYYDTPKISYCDVQEGWEGEGNIDVDPCVVQAGYWDANGTPDDANDDFWVDGDYHLLASSPCINAGDPNLAAGPNESDIDGEPRVFAGRVDMGADEFVPSIECGMKCTPQAFNACSQGSWVKAHCVLPAEFGLEDVDANSPLIIIEPVRIEAQDVNVFVNEEGMVEIHAAFDRSVFCSIPRGNRTITAIGSLTDGQDFCGMDTIRVITGNLECIADFASRWLEANCAAPDWCDGFDLDHNSTINFIDFALSECCTDKTVE